MKLANKVISLHEAEITFKDFNDKIVSSVSKLFPNASITAKLETSLGQSDMISFLLIGDKKDYINGIAGNDPLQTVITVKLPYGSNFSESDLMPEKITVDMLIGGSLNVYPEEGSNLAIGSSKIGWRKKTGTPDKVADYIINYFKKARKVVDKERDAKNIYHIDEIPDKYFK